jgi:hypothetical protein
MEVRNGNGLGPLAAAMTIKAAMIGLGVAASLLAFARAGLADEPPHLEFARRLRAQGMPGLALEYLEKLRKKPPPALADRLPVEMAEARLDMARAAVHDRERDALCIQSRRELGQFLRQGLTPTLAIEVEFELARVDAILAEGRVNRARRQESSAWRRALEARTRPLFQAAANRLTKVCRRAEAVDEAGETSAGAHPLSTLRRHAQFELGLVLFWEMKTYDDSEDLLKRGEVAKKAIGALEEVAGSKKDSLSWEARAWLGRCHAEIDAPAKARQELEAAIHSTADGARSGRRLARCFWLLVRNPGPTDAVGEKQKLAEDWLRDYPSFAGTPEGLNVRFILADALARPAQQKGARPAPDALTRAEKLFEIVARSDTDLAALARERKLDLFIAREKQHLSGEPESLKTFDHCFARAHLEIRRMAEEEKRSQANRDPAQVKKREASQLGHYDTIIRLVRRALDLNQSAASTPDVHEARYVLTYSFLASGRLREAATFGEQAARMEPESDRAPVIAAYALQAYAQLLTREKRDGADRPDAVADGASIDRLAHYVVRTWPDELAAQVARHELGAVALANKKYTEAIDFLSPIAPEYPSYSLAQYQLAGAALAANEAGTDLPPGHPPYVEQAVTALQRIPDLANDADPATSQAFFYGKLQLAKLFFARRNYESMERLADNLLNRFREATLDEQTKNDLRPAIEALPLYALYGRASLAYQARKYAEAREMLAPFLTQWIAGESPKTKDSQLLASLLRLGLGASVLENDLKEARRLLSLSSHDYLGDQKGSGILFEVVQDLRAQIEGLRENGADAQGKLDKATAAFGAFLDELTRQPVEKQTPELIRIVAIGYAGLEQHHRAADLLERVPPPSASDQEKETLYHAIRLLYARESRLAKEFSKAGQALTEILAADWGQRSIDARKEQILLLEDEGKFPQAIRAWTELMAGVRRQIDQNARLRDQYFDCYYHLVHCRCQHAKKLTDEEKRRTALRRAAGLIVKLETTMPDMGGSSLKKRYEALLQEPALKEQYDELKKGSP